MLAPSRGGPVSSSLFFLVTSHAKDILSKGSSFFLAVLCIIAVRKDCGLKKPKNMNQSLKVQSLKTSRSYLQKYVRAMGKSYYTHSYLRAKQTRAMQNLRSTFQALLFSTLNLSTKLSIRLTNHKLFWSKREVPDPETTNHSNSPFLE